MYLPCIYISSSNNLLYAKRERVRATLIFWHRERGTVGHNERSFFLQFLFHLLLRCSRNGYMWKWQRVTCTPPPPPTPPPDPQPPPNPHPDPHPHPRPPTTTPTTPPPTPLREQCHNVHILWWRQIRKSLSSSTRSRFMYNKASPISEPMLECC